MEIWKQHPRQHAYEVSTLGRIRRCEPGGGGTYVGRPLTPYVWENPDTGYCTLLVCLGKRKSGSRGSRRVRVARFVLEAFHGPARGRMACHLNNNSLECGLENLCWGSAKLNAQHRMMAAAIAAAKRAMPVLEDAPF